MKKFSSLASRLLVTCTAGLALTGLQAQQGPANPTPAQPPANQGTTIQKNGGIVGKDSNGNDTTSPQNRKQNQNGKAQDGKSKTGTADRSGRVTTDDRTADPQNPTAPVKPTDPTNPTVPPTPNPNPTDPTNPTKGQLPQTPATPPPVR